MKIFLNEKLILSVLQNLCTQESAENLELIIESTIKFTLEASIKILESDGVFDSSNINENIKSIFFIPIIYKKTTDEDEFNSCYINLNENNTKGFSLEHEEEFLNRIKKKLKDDLNKFRDNTFTLVVELDRRNGKNTSECLNNFIYLISSNCYVFEKDILKSDKKITKNIQILLKKYAKKTSN